MSRQKTFRLDRVVRRLLVVVVACLSLQTAPAAAANDLCGAIIVANLKLDHDLTCAGDALIVGADGIRIDLNGHTLTGSGSGVGISVGGRTRVSIAAGRILNFAVGVLLINATDIVIKNNLLRQNAEGIDLQTGSRGNTSKGNEFSDNTTRAMMLRTGATDNVIKENVFIANRIGVLRFGGVDNILKENSFSASTVAGIRFNVVATRNLILENMIVSNAAGIDFVVTATGPSTGNRFLENRIATNDCELKGPIAGNVFHENVSEQNGADTCPAG